MASGNADWTTIASWLRKLGSSVLLCIDNAEEPLLASIAQVLHKFFEPIALGREVRNPTDISERAALHACHFPQRPCARVRH